jgi:poly(A) polymerase
MLCFSFRDMVISVSMEQKTPLIIARPDHNISRSLLSPNAVKTLYRLKSQGFTAYLVGGCVRDLLLGREPKDFDLVTDATPSQIKRMFRNCRLVGRRFRLAHLHFADEIIEVATFRAEEPDEPASELPAPPERTAPTHSAAKSARQPRHLKSDEGVVLRDNVFGSPEQDALRRDFSVNALIYDIGSFSIIDYAGGLTDLRRAVIRTIGVPVERFTEDPVRMLRAVRFAAMLGFTIGDETWNAMVEQSENIARSAPPRLYEELLKLFLCGEGEKSYQLLRRSGLLQALFPDFSKWLDRETDGFPHARISHALDWIDGRIGEGAKISPQLLLALIFGEYLDEKGGEFRKAGVSMQESLDMAIAGFLGELAPTVLIPNRVGIQVRDILSSQSRFDKIPGKRPISFIARHSFPDAFAYFGLVSAATGENPESRIWWERFVIENPQHADVKPSAEKTPLSDSFQPKRSRRRRGRKKSAAPQSP